MTDIRTSMGLDAEETAFDGELETFVLGAINSLTDQGSVAVLTLGVSSFDDITWIELLSEPKYQDNGLEGLIKEYVTLHTRILFDPPPPRTQGYMESRLKELEWRIQGRVEDVDRPVPDSSTTPELS